MEARAAGTIRDVILLLEHEPVITLGRAADPANVLATGEALAKRGVDLVATGRGGDVTYHGPGQLVGYPILDLKPDRCDVRKYVRALAEVMILLAREHDVAAGTYEGHVGVWVDREAPHEWAGAEWARALAKVGAIGVRISRWITMHGFALNLSVDPLAFAMIVPCGIREHPVASLHALSGSPIEVSSVALRAAPALSKALDIDVERVEDLSSEADLDRALAR